MTENQILEPVAWVTGGAGGIGGSTARQLAKSGAIVWVCDLDTGALERIVDGIRAAGGNAHAVACDVTDETAVAETVATIARTSGRLDILINNAGTVHVDDILDLPVKTWRKVMEVNSTGAFIAAQAAARQMVSQATQASLNRKGLIANIGSSAAEIGRPRLAAYGASKAVVRHLTMSMHEALKDKGVAVNLIYPGAVIDGMYESILKIEAAAFGVDLDTLRAERAADAPTGDYQDVNELGALIARNVLKPGTGDSGRVLWTGAHTAVIA